MRSASGAFPIAYTDVEFALYVLPIFGDDPAWFGARTRFHLLGGVGRVCNLWAVGGAELVLYTQ